MNGIVTTSDLVLIIEACNRNRVEQIKLGKIHIIFASTYHPHENRITSGKDAKSSDMGVENPTDNLHPDSPLDADFVETPFVDCTDDQADQMDELEYLSIENPAAFEELTIKALRETQGDIIDGRNTES